MDRYFSYCRKSTDDEDHQVLSIESQQQELKRFTEREKLHIVGTKVEARSAKSPGRPIFNELLSRIGRGEANGILAWHPDRIARNALDGGQIIHLLDTGKLQNLKFPTYTFENTPQGKFMLAIMFGQSKYYVDSLSENVRRGNRTKRERGWFPGRAPMGYLNGRAESGESIIVRDPVRFPIMKEMWGLLLTGGYSVAQILDIATNKMGFRTAKHRRMGGNPLSVSGIYRIFSNPFYAGRLVFENQSYPAKHEPMITLAQFERAQELIGRSDRARPKKYTFAYTGLIRCGTCGSGITAEHKINRFGSRYVYYHCTHKRRDVSCREKCIAEDQLEEQILVFLKSIYLGEDEVQRALEFIEGERISARSLDHTVKESIDNAIEVCGRSLDNLTKLRYRELIDDNEFLRQRTELERENALLNEQLQHLETEEWIEPSRRLFSFSNRAVFWLAHGTANEKRLIASTVGSNLMLAAKKLSIDAQEPFRIIQMRTTIPNLQAMVRDVHTFFTKNPGFDVPLLPDTHIEYSENLAA